MYTSQSILLVLASLFGQSQITSHRAFMNAYLLDVVVDFEMISEETVINNRFYIFYLVFTSLKNIHRNYFVSKCT